MVMHKGSCNATPFEDLEPDTETLFRCSLADHFPGHICSNHDVGPQTHVEGFSFDITCVLAMGTYDQPQVYLRIFARVAINEADDDD
jgi:hypothetical protein